MISLRSTCLFLAVAPFIAAHPATYEKSQAHHWTGDADEAQSWRNLRNCLIPDTILNCDDDIDCLCKHHFQSSTQTTPQALSCLEMIWSDSPTHDQSVPPVQQDTASHLLRIQTALSLVCSRVEVAPEQPDSAPDLRKRFPRASANQFTSTSTFTATTLSRTTSHPKLQTRATNIPTAIQMATDRAVTLIPTGTAAAAALKRLPPPTQAILSASSASASAHVNNGSSKKQEQGTVLDLGGSSSVKNGKASSLAHSGIAVGLAVAVALGLLV